MPINFSNKNILKKSKSKNEPKGGSIELESMEEVQDVISFSAKAKAEKDKFKDNVDANYFTVITFNNSKQLDEFFNKLGIKPPDKQYIDGRQFAKKLGITIEAPDKNAPGSFKVNKELKNMTL